MAQADNAAIARMMTGELAADVLDLSIGEPDQPLHPALVEVARRSLSEGRTGYTPKLGLDDLRSAVALDIASATNRAVAVDDVIITTGGTEAVSVAIRAACAPGDLIVIPDPAWPNYLVVAEHHRLRVATYAQGLDAATFFDFVAIRAALEQGARMVVVNSPSNPVGTVASASALAELVALVRQYGAYILSDEAYESVVFAGGRAPSPLTAGADVTFSARTFSKTHSMTGLRVGSLVSPGSFRVSAAAIHGTTVGCAPITAQLVALTALTGMTDRAGELSRIYGLRHREAREIVGDWMPSAPVDEFGGFYAWLDTTASGRTGFEIVRDVRASGIAVSDGRAFSPASTHTVRVALTAPDEQLQHALGVIRAALLARP